MFHDIPGHVGHIADDQIKISGECTQIAEDFVHRLKECTGD